MNMSSDICTSHIENSGTSSVKEPLPASLERVGCLDIVMCELWLLTKPSKAETNSSQCRWRGWHSAAILACKEELTHTPLHRYYNKIAAPGHILLSQKKLSIHEESEEEARPQRIKTPPLTVS